MRGSDKGERIRVLLAKLGLDAHYSGMQLVAYTLRNHGMEVIYAPPEQTPEAIAEIALQEDINVLGLSLHCGNHLLLLPQCVKHLREKGKGDALVIAGGIIPEEDRAFLKAAGIVEIWGPGEPTRKIAKFIEDYFACPSPR